MSLGARSNISCVRPRQLWQLGMTTIWVAEHGWTYLNAIIDCCTREAGKIPKTTPPEPSTPEGRRSAGSALTRDVPIDVKRQRLS
jgi:hypothetical protein